MRNVIIDGYSITQFNTEAICIENFISVPQKLYSAKLNPQNPKEEQLLLLGKHTLSKYIRLVPFLLQQENSIIGRAALTFYPQNPDLAYLGFFEMLDDQKAAAAFFAALEGYARIEGCNRMVGPMNASFWLGYRMKADRFDEAPYFGEPYNLPYYPQLWQGNGYVVTDEYISNRYRQLQPGIYQNKRYEKRLQFFLQAGYVISPPRKDNWDTTIRDVYRLIVKLYRTFPGFSPIGEEEFMSNFSGLKMILDFSLCRMAYWNNQAVGFAITIPDYGTFLNNISIWKLPKLLWQRSRSRRYVILYVGVEPEHKGIGTAMAQELVQELAVRRAVAIGALIHKGKVTQGYAADFIEAQSHYWLFEKNIHLPQTEVNSFGHKK